MISLDKANLERANLREATLVRADLREANLREADLREATLSYCLYSNTDFSNLWFLSEAKFTTTDRSDTPYPDELIELVKSKGATVIGTTKSNEEHNDSPS